MFNYVSASVVLIIHLFIGIYLFCRFVFIDDLLNAGARIVDGRGRRHRRRRETRRRQHSPSSSSESDSEERGSHRRRPHNHAPVGVTVARQADPSLLSTPQAN